jgi:DNA-binding NarL/FixJ family response regulator
MLSSNGESVTVVLATDSFLIGDGLEAILAGVPDVTVVGRVRDAGHLAPIIAELDPHAVLICVRSRVVTTTAIVATVRDLRMTCSGLGIVVVSDRVREFALEFPRGGLTGVAFLLDERLPDIETVVTALRGSRLALVSPEPGVVDSFSERRDVAGMDDLTPREVEILEQMAHGMSNRGIADELQISIKSIEKGVTAIYLKLVPTDRGLSDRRVSSSLAFLRTQTDPFGSGSNSRGPMIPIVVVDPLKDPVVLRP